MVDFLRQSEGIDQSILAGRSLTGNHRTHLGTGSSAAHACRLDRCLELVDLFIRNSLHLHGQSGGKGHDSVSIFLCRVCDRTHLSGGDFSVYSNNPGGKIIGSLVAQKSHSFYSFFICYAYC